MIVVICARCGTKHFADQQHVGKFLKCAGCPDAVLIRAEDEFKATNDALQPRNPARRSIFRKAKRSVLLNRTNSRRNAATWCSVVLLVTFASWFTFSRTRRIRPINTARVETTVTAQSAAEESSTTSAIQELVTPAPGFAQLQPADVDVVPRRSSASHHRKSTDPYSEFGGSLVPGNTEPARLANGEQLSAAEYADGHGKLDVINGLAGEDAVVVLVRSDTNQTARRTYIRGENRIDFENLSPGLYELMFTTGEDWDSSKEEFKRNPTYMSFGSTLRFDETEESDGIEYDHQSITLHPVVGGNVRAHRIDRARFKAALGTISFPEPAGH